MNNPWDIKESDKREADSIPTFIIFCEDRVSEPIYLRYFGTEKIKINLITEQKSMMENVLKAIHHCKINELFEEGVQVWCVYDRDKGGDAERISFENTVFDTSISTANSYGIKVAWSNDAFELWVLLHFEDVDVADISTKERITYYDRLTEIFKGIKAPNDDLIKVLKRTDFYYKTHLKSEENFRNIVRSEIIPKTKDAIARAKLLENHFNKTSLPNHEKAPCTMMHHLLEELLRLGEKEI